jgi:hypothetical protein
VTIDDKHIEIIIRQMMRKVRGDGFRATCPILGRVDRGQDLP